jgi:hypothetical protein
MLFATVNGEKIEATPKITGNCPLCERTVFSKCGEINIWHWAHRKDESCDSWYEPETEWHKNWKLTFGKDNCEIVISKDCIKHIADIFTNDKVVIELQNSPIQKPIIRRRENFYGERMLWVINGKHFKENFIFISSSTNSIDYHWWEKYVHTKDGIVDRVTGEIIPPRKEEFIFKWSWPRKCWTDAERHIFIDFGKESLFWVTEGIGTNYGKGKLISKQKFLEKYGGDINLLSTIIDKPKSK